MSSKEEPRIFIGGLSWDTTDRDLDDAFRRFGKIVETQIMLERDTGRPRGFGFVTFTDQRAVEDAIAEMHGQDLAGRNITVNKAQPKVASDDSGYGYGSRGGGGGGYSSGGRGSYRSGDGPPPVGRSECFKCGRSGHWARDCSSGGGGSDSRFSSRPRSGGAGGGRGGDRYGGSDRYGDDRYDGGRYGDRDRIESRDKYSSGRVDRYDRYPPAGDRYGAADRYPQNGYSKDRSYDRDGPRSGSGRYGSGGPSRYEGGSSYRERPAPYDRPARVVRPSSYEDRYP